jgi:very-short-patch-repair endonuclease
MLDRSLQRSVTLDAVRRAHYRNLGCYGSRAAGELLQVAADGAAAVSERLLIAGLKSAGIRGARMNRPVELPGLTAVPDLTFVREKIAIEVDGWAWHHTPDRFQRDRQRQNALVTAGWLVLRFTWFDLTERLPTVIQQILLALQERRRAS